MPGPTRTRPAKASGLRTLLIAIVALVAIIAGYAFLAPTSEPEDIGGVEDIRDWIDAKNAAVAEGRWADLLKLYHPEHRPTLVGLVVFGRFATRAAQEPTKLRIAMRRVCRKHHVTIPKDVDALLPPPPGREPPGGLEEGEAVGYRLSGLEEAARTAFRDADLGALYTDAIRAILRAAPQFRDRLRHQEDPKPLRDAKITVTGDQAEVQFEPRRGPGEAVHVLVMKFVGVQGRWFRRE